MFPSSSTGLVGVGGQVVPADNGSSTVSRDSGSSNGSGVREGGNGGNGSEKGGNGGSDRGSGPNRDRVFRCNICDRTFGYKHVLQNHERTHTGEKPFECRECHKRFTRDHHLKTHMRLHTGEKPYHCPHCDRHFVQVANLRRHLRVHTGERPYACETCDSKFSDSNQLKAHNLIHRNEKPFACIRCNGKFRRRHHLMHHKCPKDDSNIGKPRRGRRPRAYDGIVDQFSPPLPLLSLPGVGRIGIDGHHGEMDSPTTGSGTIGSPPGSESPVSGEDGDITDPEMVHSPTPSPPSGHHLRHRTITTSHHHLQQPTSHHLSSSHHHSRHRTASASSSTSSSSRSHHLRHHSSRLIDHHVGSSSSAGLVATVSSSTNSPPSSTCGQAYHRLPSPSEAAASVAALTANPYLLPHLLAIQREQIDLSSRSSGDHHPRSHTNGQMSSSSIAFPTTSGRTRQPSSSSRGSSTRILSPPPAHHSIKVEGSDIRKNRQDRAERTGNGSSSLSTPVMISSSSHRHHHLRPPPSLPLTGHGNSLVPISLRTSPPATEVIPNKGSRRKPKTTVRILPSSTASDLLMTDDDGLQTQPLNMTVGKGENTVRYVVDDHDDDITEQHDEMDVEEEEVLDLSRNGSASSKITA